MKYKAFIFFLLSFSLIYSQSDNEIQSMLVGHLNKINHYKYDFYQPDSVESENTNFKRLLIKYLGGDPASFSSSMEKVVQAGLMIAASDDNMFRIYSWDTQTGGTMHFYDNIYQYKADDKIYIKENVKDTAEYSDPGSWYSNIYTMSDAVKTYYLGVSNSEYSTRDIAQSINFFAIESNKLNTALKIAKTTEGLSSGLGVSFDFFKLKDHDERPLKIVTYDPATKTISVPDVSEGALTGKYIKYKFTNGFFTETK